MRVSASFRHLLYFIVLLVALSWWYGYFELWDAPPQSHHSWRQTDGLSMVYHYYQGEAPFAVPRFLNVINDNGTDQCISEFPVLYYLSAQLCRWFGYSDAWLRLLSFACYVAGIWAFSRLLYRLSGAPLPSAAAALLLLASPLAAYYGFNYIPDAPAVGIAFVGWYAFGCYFLEKQKRYLWLGAVAFLLAGALKITVLVSLVGLIGLWVLGRLGVDLGWGRRGLFAHPWMAIVLLFGVLLAVTGWYAYASWLKAEYQSAYFLTSLRPYWQWDEEYRSKVWENLETLWWPNFYPWITQLLLGLLALWAIWRQWTRCRVFSIWVGLMTAGGLAFFILWFGQLNVHDYYLVQLLVVPAAIILAAHPLIWNAKQGVWTRRVATLLLLAILAFNGWKSGEEMQARYDPEGFYMIGFNTTFLEDDALQVFLQERGIEYPDLVMSMSDISPNHTLYLMRVRGFSLFNAKFRQLPGTEHGRVTPTALEFLIRERGLEYLVVADEASLKREDLQPYFRHEMGVFRNSIHLFDLRPLKKGE